MLRLGLPRRSDSLLTRVAPSALAKRETGIRPNGLGSNRGMGRWRYMSSPGSLRPIAHPRPSSPRPSTSTRARARWRRSPCSCGPPAPAGRRACRRAGAPPSTRAAWQPGREPGPMPGPSNGARRPGSGHAASTITFLRCLLPALVMPPWATFSPLECSEGVSPSHAANDLAFRNLANSPASNTMSAAVATSMPFRHRRESPSSP